ncbi:MAG: restriction endonuclease subunit S [Candidatus Competibacter sp.]|nr:restriction endonuclease subunit S [Candidatus Competibacter sp.]
MECVLKDLIAVSKDGEWGKGEPFDDSVEMLAIRGTDFDDVRFGSTDSTPRRHIAKRHVDRKRLEPWDIIIEAAGGTKNQITGRTVLLRPQLFSKSELPLTCASFSRFIRFNTKLCNPEYMFWYLQHLYATGLMHAYHTQHTGVARFQWTTFSEREPLELPPLPVQRRIASILSAYDELIENSQRRIKILEAMARALYREWFVHFRFPGHDNHPRVASPLGEIPQGWEVKLVKDILSRRVAGTVYREAHVKAKGAVPVLDQSSSELLGFHDDEPDHIASPVEPLAIFGDHTCKMQLLIEPFSIGPNVVPFAANRDLPTAYVFYAVSSLVQTQEYKRHWIPLNAKEIIVADSTTARRFASLIQPMLVEQATLRKAIRNLRRTRDLLLPRLLSGQIDLEHLNHA